MSLSSADLRHLLACATAAAREAGRFVADARPETVERKAGGGSLASRVVTEVDRQSEQIIIDALAPTLHRFDLAVLTEERDDDGSRHVKPYFWCIDPIDGTLPFIRGRAGYSVSIALVSRAGTPQIGVAFDPVHGTLYSAACGMGVFLDDAPWLTDARPPGKVLSLFTDEAFVAHDHFPRIAAGLQLIAESRGLQPLQVHAGAGAVINACRVLAEPPACFFKFPKPQGGGGSLWDYAATACLFEEAGAIATDMDGAPLELNRSDSTFMNHRGVVYATDAELAECIRQLAPSR